MTIQLPSGATWAETCNIDPEFRLAARHWNGGLTLRIGEQSLAIGLTGGQASASEDDATSLGFSGPVDVWEKLLAATPPRFHTDVFAALSTGAGLERHGDPVEHAQYYAAVSRAIELLRPPAAEAPADNEPDGDFATPVGRYVYLTLQGQRHRIYFEEAGTGIPLLMQHTAGCHGSQWRHLFEDPRITDHFRLIAYDLPFHGKSLPPTGVDWWQEKYDLHGEFLREVPLALAAALELDDPVFMGCSVGGLLALDLAARHPESFRAVISVEGALNIDGSVDGLKELWHPQVSNEYKARAMEGLMSPTSPRAYVKETSFVYASGWPPVFLGDLYYYIEDYDLRNQVPAIDTDKVGVHILSGEYDHSGTSERGREAHAAIAGSTWAEMKGVGHFPMSENPAAFIDYLLPVLDRIRNS